MPYVGCGPVVPYNLYDEVREMVLLIVLFSFSFSFFFFFFFFLIFGEIIFTFVNSCQAPTMNLPAQYMCHMLRF